MKQRVCLLTTVFLLAAGLTVAQRGSAAEAPSCEAFASSIVTGADGNLWIGEAGDEEIARVSPAGGPIAEFPLFVPHRAEMTPGPDGNLWVLRNYNEVSRVTPDGQIDSFALPEAPVHNNSHELGLAVGPDGNIWALRSMNGDDRLTQVTTSGAVTDFAINVVNPDALVTAAGALWFLERTSGTSRLYRADTAGNISIAQTFDGLSLIGLVVGPDGALWSIGSGPAPESPRLVRMPVDGSDPASFTLPLPWGETPTSLILGPDARLWAIASGTALIAMDTSANATTYPFPDDLDIQAIAAGPDGNVWFVGSDDVGSISVTGTSLTSRLIPISTGSAIACSATPAFGRVVGGETITLAGRGFGNVTEVWFDAYRAPSFTVLSEREMTVVTPAHPRGVSDLELETVAGRQTFNTQFRFAVGPTVSSVCPNVGPTTGGYWVTIGGRDVDLATLVSFGGTLSTTVQQIQGPFGRNEPDRLRVLVPARRGGGVKMQASGPAGTGPKGAVFVYTQAAPVPLAACLGDAIGDPGLLPDPT
jgi:streptogramin lyase